MYYYLYKITNLVNNKIYVGVHKTKNLDDNYMGSGKVISAAIKKYSLENFKKEILEYFDTATSMFAREKEIVNEDFLSRCDVYNLRRGGHGGFDYINTNLELVKKRNKIVANIRDNTNRIKSANIVRATDAYRKNMSKVKLRYFESNPGTFTGKTHSDDTIQQMKISAAGKHVGEKNSQFGTMWITNGQENKKIKKDIEIPVGWRKGRVS